MPVIPTGEWFYEHCQHRFRCNIVITHHIGDPSQWNVTLESRYIYTYKNMSNFIYIWNIMIKLIIFSATWYVQYPTIQQIISESKHSTTFRPALFLPVTCFCQLRKERRPSQKRWRGKYESMYSGTWLNPQSYKSVPLVNKNSPNFC